ncbi:MAG: CBS domain-containing protein [Planctomycetota bacterium]|nr:CBS domain-containing protein [Planctomycetota bacterium]
MNRPLMQIATMPAESVTADASVAEAVERMVGSGIGAVAVVEAGQLSGIFTERDLMTKVVAKGAEMATLAVRDVMVSNPIAVPAGATRDEAMELMLSNHFRHLPVTGDDGSLLGMLSIRDLLRHQVDRLRDDVQSLQQYLAADGPGG